VPRIEGGQGKTFPWDDKGKEISFKQKEAQWDCYGGKRKSEEFGGPANDEPTRCPERGIKIEKVRV